jgi:hypothetical protein
MTLKRGARQSLNYLQADLDDIIELAHNPTAVRKLARRCKERLAEEIEPKLQRAVPTLEARLSDLEERLRRVEEQRVVVLHRKEAPERG